MTRVLDGYRRSQCCALASAACLAALVLPAPGAAEPIRIEQGEIHLARLGAEESLFFQTRTLTPAGHVAPFGFGARRGETAAGDVDIAWPATPDPIATGASLNLSTHVTWTGAILSYGDTAARSFGAFTIHAGNAVLEHIPAPPGFGAGVFTGTTPFSFAGVIHVLDAASGAPLLVQPVHGRGTARFSFNPDHPDAFIFNYRIEPIPEPATMTLLGLGAAGLAARRRVSRRLRHVSADC